MGSSLLKNLIETHNKLTIIQLKVPQPLVPLVPLVVVKEEHDVKEEEKAKNLEEVGEKIENRADNRVGKAIEGPDNLNNEDNTKADLSTESEIQQPKQSGYCYIGTDRTFRSCVKMNAGDTCASKQVFPTKDICINPTLRK